ncbi:MAG: hypothetical protein LBD88_00795 [Candidatus Peribacteria bacterium]|jgi:hypothetical protein|nr:hypothetical protein [Candidatus Peribacteria bacterium]
MIPVHPIGNVKSMNIIKNTLINQVGRLDFSASIHEIQYIIASSLSLTHQSFINFS